LFVFLAGCTNLDPVESGLVVNIVDGDTIDVLVDDETVRVRLLGMDTPETYGGVECYGPEATQYTGNLLGKHVTLYPDTLQKDKDAFGRSLRYVHLNGQDFNALLVKEGYAYAYTKIESDRLDHYLSLEDEAMLNNRGLWAECP
jgi:micrococcal nuclease